jgi:hypothetical protein
MLDKKEEICEGCIQSFKRINEEQPRKWWPGRHMVLWIIEIDTSYEFWGV